MGTVSNILKRMSDMSICIYVSNAEQMETVHSIVSEGKKRIRLIGDGVTVFPCHVSALPGGTGLQPFHLSEDDDPGRYGMTGLSFKAFLSWAECERGGTCFDF